MKNNQLKNNFALKWKHEELRDLLDYEQPANYIVASENYNDNYKVPVLTAGKTFILGYTDENFGICKKLPVIIFDDFVAVHKFVDFPFKVKSSAIKILKAKNNINLKFIYGWMQIHPYSVGEHKRNYLSEYQYQDVLIPSFLEQNRIVAVIDAWDEMIKKIAKKIEIKKQIKKGLMDKYIYKRNDSVEHFIDEIFELGRGRVISKEEIEKNIGDYPVYSSQTSNHGILGSIKTYDFEGEYLTWTTDGANAGRVFYRNGRFNCTNVCGVAKLKSEIDVDPYFVYLYLNYITRNYVSYVGNPKLMNGVFAKIKIKLPDIKEQIKASNIITVADKEISELEKKLLLIKDQKKYLLDNLITGKIRTPETLSIKS